MIRASITYPSGSYYSVELDGSPGPEVRNVFRSGNTLLQYRLPDSHTAMSLTLSTKQARILAHRLLASVAESATEE